MIPTTALSLVVEVETCEEYRVTVMAGTHEDDAVTLRPSAFRDEVGCALAANECTRSLQATADVILSDSGYVRTGPWAFQADTMTAPVASVPAVSLLG